MSVVSGQTLSGEFPTNGAGGLQDADSTPTATLVVNGDNTAASVSITHKSTGRYEWSCTAPSLSDGDNVQLVRTATVDGFTTNRVVWQDTTAPGIASAQTLAGEFCINGGSGAQNADSSPTGVLVLNGANNAASITITNKATGRYKWSCTAPTVAEGDNLELVRLATVDGNLDAAIVWQETAPAQSTAEIPSDVGSFAQMCANDLETMLNTDFGFGQSVIYNPLTGAPRTIKAVVDFNPPVQDGQTVRPKMLLIVANNDTTGILSSSLNAGGDTVTVAYRKGETARTYLVRRAADPYAEDSAALRLELH